MKASQTKSNDFSKNPEYKAALAEMRAEYNDETQSKVINAALRCTFLVPALIDESTRLVADKDNKVHFDDRPQAKFLLIEHKKLGTYLPAFTDKEEIDKFEADGKHHHHVAMKFNQVAHLVEQMPNVNGFVVNPFGDALPFNKELLDEILKRLLEAQKKQQENENKN